MKETTIVADYLFNAYYYRIFDTYNDCIDSVSDTYYSDKLRCYDEM